MSVCDKNVSTPTNMRASHIINNLFVDAKGKGNNTKHT